MRILIATILAGAMMISQADARGGGGGGHGGGGGFRGGGVAISRVAPAFPRVVHNQGFIKKQNFLVNRNLVRQFRFNNGVGFANNRFNRSNGQQWNNQNGWWWPVGGDWSSGGYQQAPVAAAPADPQVIVLSSANPAQHVAAIEQPADYGYAGCRQIPNGYTCGQ